ncbi:MAG: universal stress protein [Betaproteobacteria bacterium]
MRKLLVSIDGHSPARMMSAVAQAIAIYRQEPVDIYLLNVQPGVTGHVAMFFDAAELHDIQNSAAREELAPALALFAAAGIPCVTRVVIGRNAAAIALQAQQLGCDRIIIGREEGESLANRVFGNLVEQVRHIVSAAGNCQVLGS